MRKYAVAVLLSALVLAACGAPVTDPSVSGSGASADPVNLLDNSAHESECDTLVDDYTSGLDDLDDLIGLAGPSDAASIVEIGHAAVEAGRAIYVACSDFLPYSFSSNIDDLEDAVDGAEASL